MFDLCFELSTLVHRETAPTHQTGEHGQEDRMRARDTGCPTRKTARQIGLP